MNSMSMAQDDAHGDAALNSFQIDASQEAVIRQQYKSSIGSRDKSNFLDAVMRTLKKLEGFALTEGSMRVWVQDQQEGLNVSCNKTFATIGRCKSSIKIDEKHAHISRVHAFLTVVQKEDARFIMIIDFWSSGGTRVGGQEQHVSLPDNRRVIIVPYDVPVLVQVGEFTGRPLDIHINYKECCICMVQPRTERLNCGHLVACSDCMRKMQVCPMCREENCESQKAKPFDPGECHTFFT